MFQQSLEANHRCLGNLPLWKDFSSLYTTDCFILLFWMKGGYIYWKPKGGKKKPKSYQTVAKVIYAWSLSATHVLIHNLKLRRKHASTTGRSSKAESLWMRTGWKQFLAPDTAIWDPTPSPASVWTSQPYFTQPGLLLIPLCHWERPSLVAKRLQISFITLALQLPKCPSCELIYTNSPPITD